jgi:hypothetical protein
VTLFAFDDVSIPFTQNLRLEMRPPERRPGNPVLWRGGPGAADSWAAQFYGSVIRENGKFRMWYVAAGDDRLDPNAPRSTPWRVAYAESKDGVHFRMPAHDWVFLKRGEDGEWDQGGLLQEQGFVNVGNQTYIYYHAWDPRSWQDSPPRGGVGIATLERDRFAHLVVDQTAKGRGDYQIPEIMSDFITVAITLEGDGPHRFFLTADGLGDEATLKVELLSRNAVPPTGILRRELRRRGQERLSDADFVERQRPARRTARTSPLQGGFRGKAEHGHPFQCDIRAVRA